MIDRRTMPHAGAADKTFEDRLIEWILRIVARLPLRASHALGTLIGWLLARIPNKQRRNGLINIRLCLAHLSEDEARRFRDRSLAENGKTYAEIAYLWLRPPERVLARVRELIGGDALKRRPGEGVIVLSPHLGAWELAGLYLSSLGPTTTLYKPQRRLDSLIRDARARLGANLVPTTARGVRGLVAALERGEYVGILPDQEPRENRGSVFAPFFGVPALTMLLINRLARRTGARVVFLFAERLPRAGGYRLHCIEGDQAIADENDQVAATALNRGIETCIGICPEQYIWPYKRFRRRPAGEERIYRGPL